MGDSEPKSLESKTEDRRKAAEIQYLCNLLLRADYDSKGITKPVPDKLIDNKIE